MRTVLVYAIAAAALAAALFFGFPELFASAKGGTKRRHTPRIPPVVVVEVQAGPFEDTLEALGTVRANESVDITPNRADHIAKIHFEDGQRVEKGTILVEMRAKEEAAQLNEAMAVRDDRRLNHSRAKELFDQKLTSERAFQNSRALLAAAESRVISLQAAIADRTVVAPFSGVLGLRQVSAGAYVQPSTLITTLDDISVVKVDFTVPEAWLPDVRPGMSIAARSVAWPDQVFRGEVTTIDTRLDIATRSATFRALIDNKEGRLRPGMLLRLVIERGEDAVLQVPEEALILRGQEHSVLLVDDKNRASRVPVKIGRRRVGTVEIRSGIQAGNRVVIEGIVPVKEGLVSPGAQLAVKVVEVRKVKG